MGGAQKCSFLFCEFMLLNQTWVCSPAHSKASLLTQGCDGSESCSVVSPWTVARQAALSMGFSRQEYWSGLPFPSPGNLPNPGTKPRSPALQADSSPEESSPESFPTQPQGSPCASKESENRMGEDIYKSYVCQGPSL